MKNIVNLVRRNDPDRFLACLFAPPERRNTLFLLSAFNHEIARAREVTSQPMLALIRLQWWRETVQGVRRNHDVAGPLGDAVAQRALDQDDLLAMIAARETEADDAMPDLASWHRYLADSAGGWAVAAGRVLGANGEQIDRLRKLGTAYGVATQLANVVAWARRDRCMLPDDVLTAHGLSREQVIQDPHRARLARPELAKMGLALCDAGRGSFPRTIIAAALPSVLAQRDLKRGMRFRGIADKVAVLGAVIRAKV